MGTARLGGPVGGVASEDIDLVVICSDKAKCEERPPIEVDLRVFEKDDVEARLSEGQALLAWAVKFGEALWRNRVMGLNGSGTGCNT